MLFTILVLIIFALFAFLLYKLGDKKFLSQSSLVLLIFSIIANIALANNYSTLATSGDGIGITNSLASWIITDKNWAAPTWTMELFRSFYENSTMVSLILLLAYCSFLLFEAKRAKK